MIRSKSLFILFIFMAFSFAHSAVINIPDEYRTIQEGINASFTSDTVLVQPGTYIENLYFGGHNISVGSLFLTTGDTSFISSTIIDGDSSGSVVMFDSGEDSTAIITGFTIQNGYAVFGGGIFCDSSSPIISFNNINSNSSHSFDGGLGGGVFCHYSNPTIMNNTIEGNVASNGGGAIYCSYSNPTITENSIVANFAVAAGGGIYCHTSDPTIVNNTIHANLTGDYGGGIFCFYSNSLVADNLLSDNSAMWGGAIFCAYYDPIINDNLITQNSAIHGGAIYYDASQPTIINNTISENAASENGGGIYSADNGFISSNIIYGNTAAGAGGGIYGAGTIDNNTISGNTATSGGGVYGGSLVSNNLIRLNSVTGNGGGIHDISGNVYVNNTIENNIASSGAGIFSNYPGAPTIAFNIIRRNTSSGNGGGICGGNTNPPDIYGNIVSENSAENGGGMYFARCQPKVDNNVISDNLAMNNGGGICIGSAFTTVRNSIIWGNQALNAGAEIYQGSDIDPIIIFCNVYGGWEGVGNIDADPLFRDPENGDFHLMSTECSDPFNSPCIDSGHPAIIDSLLDCNWGLGNEHSDMGAFGGGSVPESGRIINIPDDYPTIQEGIDASSNLDTVLVHPGLYIENINFTAHKIVLASLFLTTRDTLYISSTIIDGDSSGSVVTFENGEDNTSIIAGFTIQNGWDNAGGGISCDSASPMIIYNIIRDNSAVYGGGIDCLNANPTIKNNAIIDNSAGFGGAIYGSSNLNLMIVSNTISRNFASSTGGGIYCGQNSTAIITNTILWDDTAGTGNEIYLFNSLLEITYSDIRSHSGQVRVYS